MAITIKYKILFSIDLLHHYFLDKGVDHYESLNADQKIKQLAFYDIRNFITLTPTPSCLEIIKNHNLIFRPTPTGILIGSKIAPDNDQPFVDISIDTKFTFVLNLKSQSFFNYTALPLNFGSPQCFYFNNLEKDSSSFLNLSKNPEVFSEGLAYQAGSIVSNADGSEIFTIKNNTDNASNIDRLKDTPAPIFDNNEDYKKGDIILINIAGIDQLFESKIDDPVDTPVDLPGNDWNKLRDLPLNYANKNDLIHIRKPIHNYSLPSDDIEATATLSEVQSNGLLLIKTDAIENTNSFQFDWRTIPSGLYQFEVSDNNLLDADPGKIISQEVFYLNNAAFQSPPFGIIEIYASRSDDNNYALLQTNGTFKTTESQFILRFKNRATIWRYIFREAQAVDGADDVSIENGDDKILITNEIKPLTKNGLIEINKGENQLPNPNSNMIKPETNNIFSEIYL